MTASDYICLMPLIIIAAAPGNNDASAFYCKKLSFHLYFLYPGVSELPFVPSC